MYLNFIKNKKKMELNITINSSLPADTYCLMGFLGSDNFYTDLKTSSEETKTVVSNLINLFGSNINVNISGYDITSYFEVNIIIPEETYLDIINVDYNSLSDSDKNIVDQFVNLIVGLV